MYEEISKTNKSLIYKTMYMFRAHVKNHGPLGPV